MGHKTRRLMTIDHIECRCGDRLVWESHDLGNILHTNGEAILLEYLFDHQGNATPTFYLGLDDRTQLSAGQTITDLTGEPSAGGYSRQPLDPASSNFTVELVNGVNKARSRIVTFNCVGASWGPVTNLFLVSGSGSGAVLVSSVSLPQSSTLNPGEAINLRASLSLRDLTA